MAPLIGTQVPLLMLLLLLPTLFGLALSASCHGKYDKSKAGCEVLTNKTGCENQAACYWADASACVGDLAPFKGVKYGIQKNRVRFFLPQQYQFESVMQRAAKFTACTGVYIYFMNKDTLMSDWPSLKDRMVSDLGSEKCVLDGARNDGSWTCSREEGFGMNDAYLVKHSWVASPAAVGLLENLQPQGSQSPAWNDVFPVVRDRISKYGEEVVAWPMDVDLSQLVVRDDALITYKADTGRDIIATGGFDTWDDLSQFVRHMNGKFKADGKPDLASCMMRCATDDLGYMDKGGLLFMIYAGLMQTQGPKQGVHFNTSTMGANFENDGFAEALRIFREITAPCNVSSASACVKRPTASQELLTYSAGQCVMFMSNDPSHINNAAQNQTRLASRFRMPGWRRVVDRTTGRLVDCNSTTCPLGEKGHTINRSPVAGGGNTIVIRRSAGNGTKRALKDYLQYMTAPQQSLPDTATFGASTNHWRNSHIAEAAWPAHSSKGWSRKAFDDLVRVANDLNSSNPSLELRLRGESKYSKVGEEAVRRYFGYLIDENQCLFAAGSVGSSAKLAANLTRDWDAVTKSFGRLEQLIRYRSSLGQAPLNHTILCSDWRYDQDPKVCAKALGCTAGRYYNLTGSGRCEDCPAGQWSGSAGLTKCEVCIAGFSCPRGTSFPPPCPPGNYSTVGAAKCTQCPIGTFAAASGAEKCDSCPLGKYLDTIGGIKCKVCKQGSYGAQLRSTACTACPGRRITLMPGIQSLAGCICPKNFYSKHASDGCLACGRGLICKAGSVQENWVLLLKGVRNASSVDVSITPTEYPRLEEGFHAYASDPTRVYDCRSKSSCPGGDPGTCSGGRVPVACAKCPNGQLLKDNKCQPCESTSRMVVWFALVLLFIVVDLTYLLNNGKLHERATSFFCVSSSVAMLFTAMQVLGVFTYLSIPWPSEVADILDWMTVSLLNFEQVSSQCAYGTSSEVQRYITLVFAFPLLGCYVLLRYTMSRFMPNTLRWVFPKLLNTLGQFYQTFFIAMTTAAVSPMMCYTHPNKLRSLVKYQGVLCDSAEWTVMLVFGVALLMFALGFFCVCGYVALVIPHKALGDEQSASAVHFLFWRWRLDVWWMGAFSMFRSLLLSLALIFFPNIADVNLQLVIMIFILLLFLAVQLVFWPSKAPLLNIIDAVINADFVMMLCVSFAFAPEVAENKKETYNIMMISNLAVLYGVFGALILAAVLFLMKGTGLDPRKVATTGAPDMFLLRKHPKVEDLSSEWGKMSQNVDDFVEMQGADALCEVLQQMSIYDAMSLHRGLFILDGMGIHQIADIKQVPRSVMQLRISTKTSFCHTHDLRSRSSLNLEGTASLALASAQMGTGSASSLKSFDPTGSASNSSWPNN